MQLLLDLDNGVTVTATPFSAPDGTLGLDFQAQTPVGPMGLRATTTAAAVRGMIAAGKAKFGPGIAAYLNRVLGVSGMPPMPFSDSPVLVDAVSIPNATPTSSVGRGGHGSGNGDPYNPGGNSSDDVSMGRASGNGNPYAPGSISPMGSTANGRIEKKGNPFAGLTGAGEGPMSAGLWAHGPYAVTVPVTYRTLQPWTQPTPWWWPSAWAWHGPIPVTPPNARMSGSSMRGEVASVAGCCGGRIRTQIQEENASMGILVQGGRPRGPSMMQMAQNVMAGRANGMNASVGAPPNDPNNPNGLTPMPPVYYAGPSGSSGPFTTMPWTGWNPPGYTTPGYSAPRSDPYGYTGTPGYGEPVMLPPNPYVQEGIVPDASRFDTSPVERALSCAQRAYSRPGNYGTVLGSTYAATVLACAYSNATSVHARLVAAPGHYQSALALAVRRKVSMLGRKVTAVEVAELATAVVEMRGRATPIVGYTWGSRPYTWGNRGGASVGALPGMPGGDMFQFVPPPISPGNLPFGPFVPGPQLSPPAPAPPYVPPAFVPPTFVPLVTPFALPTIGRPRGLPEQDFRNGVAAGKEACRRAKAGEHVAIDSETLYGSGEEAGRDKNGWPRSEYARGYRLGLQSGGCAPIIDPDAVNGSHYMVSGAPDDPGYWPTWPPPWLSGSVGALPGMPGGDMFQFVPQVSPGNMLPQAPFVPFVPGPQFSPAPPAPPFTPSPLTPRSPFGPFVPSPDALPSLVQRIVDCMEAAHQGYLDFIKKFPDAYGGKDPWDAEGPMPGTGVGFYTFTFLLRCSLRLRSGAEYPEGAPYGSTWDQQQNMFVAAIQARQKALGRSLTKMELAEIASTIPLVFGGSVGALPGAPIGSAVQFAQQFSPGNLFPPSFIPFVPGPQFSPPPPAPPYVPPPFTLNPLAPRPVGPFVTPPGTLPFEETYISTGCFTWCDPDSGGFGGPDSVDGPFSPPPKRQRCALYRKASDPAGTPGPQILFFNSAEPFDGVVGRVKKGSTRTTSYVPTAFIYCPGDPRY